jgi:hypothetical protein
VKSLIPFVLALCLCGLLSSCGLLFHHHGKPVATDVGEGGPSLVGTIALVNPDAHFVLVHLGNKGASLPVGVVLRCIGPTGETGQLIVTPERKGVHFAADIKSGNPQRDDSVIYDVAPAKPSLPNVANGNAATTQPTSSQTKGGLINGLPDPSAPESGAVPSVANPANGQIGVIPQLIPQLPR